MGIDLGSIQDHFPIDKVVEIKEFDSGLINNSYYIKSRDGSEHVLQRINKEVFDEGEKLMLNLLIANDELSKLDGYRVPRIMMTRQDETLFRDAEGFEWRMMEYIQNSETIDWTDDPTVGQEVGSIISKFHHGTLGCDIERMHVTLPNFHNLDFRAEWFLRSIKEAKPNLLSQATDCIDEIEQKIDDFNPLQAFDIPVRVVHNDTKLNNVLFDKITRKALCLIDLDMIMPGNVHHDFGDAVRVLCSAVQEDDPNLDAVKFNDKVFTGFLEGYLSQMGHVLTDDEWKSLPISVELMPFIMAMRFLTDFLFGNIYYKIDYPDHNLIRCKNQLKFISETRKKKTEIETQINEFKKAYA